MWISGGIDGGKLIDFFFFIVEGEGEGGGFEIGEIEILDFSESFADSLFSSRGS